MFTDSANAVIFGKGNTLSAFIGSSIIVWPVHILIARGVKEAAAVNLVATFVKVFPLVLFIGLAIYFFSPHTFTQDMAGASLNHSVGEQVKNTMLITLWVFTGLEGASVLSAHAKQKSNVGLATVLGIVLTFFARQEMLNRIAYIGTGGLISMLVGPTIIRTFIEGNLLTCLLSMLTGFCCNVYLVLYGGLGWVEAPIIAGIAGSLVYMIVGYVTNGMRARPLDSEEAVAA